MSRLLVAILAAFAGLSASASTAPSSLNREPIEVDLRVWLTEHIGLDKNGFNLAGRHRSHGSDEVFTGQDYTLEKDQAVDGNLVIVSGHALIHGAVNGDLTLVGTTAEISGTVNGDVSMVASKVQFLPGAVINGDYVTCLSKVKDDVHVNVEGDRVNLNFLTPGTAFGIGDYLSATVFRLRPMAPDSIISWVIALAVLGISLALAHFFPRVVTDTEAILSRRAPAALLVGFLLIPASALLSFLLILTIIGAIAVPFVVAAIQLAAIAGTAAVFALIGERIYQRKNIRYPLLVWICVGMAACTIVYLIPVLGFLAGSVVFVAGLGAFSIYVFERCGFQPPGRRWLPAPETPRTAAVKEVRPALPARRPVTINPDAVRFWPRLAANVIDFLIVASLLQFVGVSRLIVPVWVIYRFAMYVWRSATIGEIVLNLEVQKLDGTTLVRDRGTAVTRALVSLLSLLPLGLGFFWILFDERRETWHDKISGTTLVRVRRDRNGPRTEEPLAPDPGPPAPPAS